MSFLSLFMNERFQMTMKSKVEKLEKIFSVYQKKLRSNGMSVLIENGTGSFTWEHSCGDLEGDQKYFIASVTKLFATTVLLNLFAEGKLSFGDKISKYLPKEYVEGLHVYKGIEYSNQLTMKHLMTQTSGLPDYFSESTKNELSGEELLKHDQILTLDETVKRTKRLPTKFAPGSKKRSYYSDINWDLFLPIIESVAEMSITECYDKYIITPLELSNTFLFTEGMEFSFPGVWIDDGIYKMPKLLLGWPLSGSIISTNRDMITFIKAFYGGKLFPKELFETENTYYYTQYIPLEYGLGNMRFRYPGIPTLYGHSGATGVLCYYAPKYDMYIAACINELNEVKATRMLAKLAYNFKN